MGEALGSVLVEETPTVPPVRMAMSSSISLRRSPKLSTATLIQFLFEGYLCLLCDNINPIENQQKG